MLIQGSELIEAPFWQMVPWSQGQRKEGLALRATSVSVSLAEESSDTWVQQSMDVLSSKWRRTEYLWIFYHMHSTDIYKGLWRYLLLYIKNCYRHWDPSRYCWLVSCLLFSSLTLLFPSTFQPEVAMWPRCKWKLVRFLGKLFLFFFKRLLFWCWHCPVFFLLLPVLTANVEKHQENPRNICFDIVELLNQYP